MLARSAARVFLPGRPTPTARTMPSVAAPRVCLLILRWGGWPAWMPLLLRSLQTQHPALAFHIIGDIRPETRPLPSNVHFHRIRPTELLRRMRTAIGPSFKITSLGSFTANTLGGEPPRRPPPRRPKGRRLASTAKINDLKPMLGQALADILAPYEWWGARHVPAHAHRTRSATLAPSTCGACRPRGAGWMQEDVILGDLFKCIGPLLPDADVISPLPQAHISARTASSISAQIRFSL